MVSLEVEAQPASQETAKSHSTELAAQLSVKHWQREGTEPNKGTVLTGTLEHRPPRQHRLSCMGAPSNHTVLGRTQRDEEQAKEAATKNMWR